MKKFNENHKKFSIGLFAQTFLQNALQLTLNWALKVDGFRNELLVWGKWWISIGKGLPHYRSESEIYLNMFEYACLYI